MASDRHRDLFDERAQTLLRALVDKYIRDGQPVGSRTLSRDSGLDLSPATIRNIVADLEHMGFVSSPHTSAGRVPTNKGYRFFVDTLIRLTPPKGEDLLRFSQGLSASAGDPQSLALAMSTLLSARDAARRHRDGAASRANVVAADRVLAVIRPEGAGDTRGERSRSTEQNPRCSQRFRRRRAETGEQLSHRAISRPQSLRSAAPSCSASCRIRVRP